MFFKKKTTNKEADDTTPTSSATTQQAQIAGSAVDAMTSEPTKAEPSIQVDPSKAQSQEPRRMEKDDGSIERRRQLAASRRKAAAFGQIVGVLMRQPASRNMTLANLDRLVAPAVASGQFLVAEAQSKENGFAAPVGVVLWAMVSGEVDKRLSAGGDIGPKDWTSGDIPWLVLAVGEERIVKPMLSQVQAKMLAGRPLKLRRPSKTSSDATATA
jgi:hemolysin-activating ACP:hemolysin acyltransferase